MPDDGIIPLVNAIEGATTSIDIKMFAFAHEILSGVIMTAHRRGVRVRVMLNPERRTGYADNSDSFVQLRAAGLEVKETNPIFEVSHEKTCVIDGKTAIVQSFNWLPEGLSKRDYAITTNDPAEVADIMACFEADWTRDPFEAGCHPAVIWCRGNGRKIMGAFIDDAKTTLHIQNERFDDMTMLEHLVRAAQRGVRLHVLADLAHHFKPKKVLNGIASLRILADVGAKVHHIKGLHAKMMLADGQRAIVGSINLSPGSFDDRRELALQTDTPEVIERLEKYFHHDWKHSHKVDLTDQGIVRDLERHHRDDLEVVFLRQERPPEAT
jgi:phosphatidylserine/phosphatidylglycerophosphate/cardiolipin synthase-like enzyme